MKTRISLTLLLMLGSLSLAPQLGAQETPASTSGLSPSSEGATLKLTHPKDGDVVPLVFQAKFLISGMGIAAAGTNIENTGHHHLLIDIDELPPMNVPLPATDQILHFGKGQIETELRLSEGVHTLQLVFGDYAHRPHDPPVVSEKITITVSAEAVPPADDDE